MKIWFKWRIWTCCDLTRYVVRLIVQTLNDARPERDIVFVFRLYEGHVVRFDHLVGRSVVASVCFGILSVTNQNMLFRALKNLRIVFV